MAAKSLRARRLRAIDELRGSAAELERVAELMHGMVGDLDRLAPNGVRHANGKGAFVPYEELEARARAYGELLPSFLKTQADQHLTEADEHDRSSCLVCIHLAGHRPKGWLTDVYRKVFRRTIDEMLRDGELDVLTEEQKRHERSAERQRLRERGELKPPAGADVAAQIAQALWDELHEAHPELTPADYHAAAKRTMTAVGLAWPNAAP